MSERPWVAHYDKGVPTSLTIPEKPLFYFLEESARKYPDRACTIFKGAAISFREMNELTDHLAAGLVDLGVHKGDRVGIFMPNTPQFVMAYFAILKAGGVVVATNPLYTPPEIARQASDAGIEIMFVMTNFYKTIKAAQPETKIRKLIVTNVKETLPSIEEPALHPGAREERRLPHRGRLERRRRMDEGCDRRSQLIASAAGRGRAGRHRAVPVLRRHDGRLQRPQWQRIAMRSRIHSSSKPGSSTWRTARKRS